MITTIRDLFGDKMLFVFCLMMTASHFKWIADRVPSNTGVSKQNYRPELAAAHKSKFMDNCLDFHLF